MNTLSIHRPLPSMLTAIPMPSSLPDRFDSHFPPPPHDPFPVRLDPVLPLQERHQPATPQPGILQVDLVHDKYDTRIFFTLLHRTVVQRRARHREDFALLC